MDIPLTKTEQGGISSADYSGVPNSVTFGSSDTEKSFTFSATQDTVDDDGESIKLTFNNLPSGVSEGTTKETVISITDDDVPSVSVEFGSATYSVEESDDTSTTEDKENEAVVTVTLSADPERTVTIPIVKANQGGASSSDYSGVPNNVVFNSGRHVQDLHLLRNSRHHRRRWGVGQAHLRRDPPHRGERGHDQGDRRLHHRRRRAQRVRGVWAGDGHRCRGKHRNGDRHALRRSRACSDNPNQQGQPGRGIQLRLLRGAQQRGLQQRRQPPRPSPSPPRPTPSSTTGRA